MMRLGGGARGGESSHTAAAPPATKASTYPPIGSSPKHPVLEWEWEGWCACSLRSRALPSECSAQCRQPLCCFSAQPTASAPPSLSILAQASQEEASCSKALHPFV
eukprot:3574227-Rhodomonas_salina.2